MASLIGGCLLNSAGAASESEPELRVGYIGTGVGQVTPNRWGLLTLTVTNPTAKDDQFLSLTFLERDPSIQYGRSVWVPAHAQRRTWQLIRLGNVPAGERSEPTVSLLVHDEPGREQMLDRRPSPILIGHPPLATALVADPNDESTSAFAIEAVKVFRGHDDTALTPRIMKIPPHNAIGYDSVRRIIVAMQHPPFDALQLEALRQWLSRGGTLWIMLDRVDADWPVTLLGKHWPFAVVDRTRLTSLQVPDESGAVRKQLTFEEPVSLVRVLSHQALADPGSVYPHHGWPTMLSLDYGRGQVIVTTLGSRGWLNGDQPTARLEALANRLHHDLEQTQNFLGPPKREPETIQAEREAQATLLTGSLVAYTIISRTWIAAVLLAYCVAFMLLALVLWRRDQLAWLGGGGLVMAFVFAGVMIGVGMMGRSHVEATTATATWVDVEPSTKMACVFGVVDIYTPLLGGAWNERITGDQPASVYWPSLKPQVGATRRLIWTDVNDWQWRGIDLPRDATIRGTLSAVAELPDVDAPVLMPADQGLRLTATDWLDAVNLRDGLIVGPGGVAWLVSDGQGNWQSGPPVDVKRDLLAKSVAESQAGPLSEMMRDAVKAASEQPDTLRLIGWTDAISAGVAVADRASNKLNRTVVSLAMELKSPAHTMQVQLPSWMLAYEVTRRRADGRSGFMTAFDPMRREWLELTQSGRINLEYRIPQALSVAQVDGLSFTLDINAPGREVQVILPGRDNVKERVLATFDSPTSPKQLRVDDLAMPFNGDDLWLTIDIGPDDDPTNLRTWQLHDMALNLTVTLQAKPNPANADGARP